MAERLAACQCTWFAPSVCKREASQEDLLCDLCRAGCAAVDFAPVGTPADQVPVTAHQPMPVTVWGDEL